METHPGQWLYEEGMAFHSGLDFKKRDDERGRLMVEASASSGFPMAVACCHLHGMNGLKEDEKKAFDMFVKIEKETNGYHWAQYMVGACYRYSRGVGIDRKEAFEYCALSAEQGNSIAMNSVAYCYHKGEGTDKNETQAFEWLEKSAKLGDCNSMYNLAICYRRGKGGVTKDLNKAKEWFAKALAQGHTGAQTKLDTLNAQ